MNNELKQEEVLNEVLLSKGNQLKSVIGNDAYLETELESGWSLVQEFSSVKLKRNIMSKKFGIFAAGQDVTEGRIVEREILLASEDSKEVASTVLRDIVDRFDGGEEFEFMNHLQVLDRFGIRELN